MAWLITHCLIYAQPKLNEVARIHQSFNTRVGTIDFMMKCSTSKCNNILFNCGGTNRLGTVVLTYTVVLTNNFLHSTSLISKKDDKKTIIEGSGSVKVKDEEKSATFKYIRTLLTEGNEQGVEVGSSNFSNDFS